MSFVSSVHSDLIKMTTTAVILVGECIEECKKKTKKCGNSHTAGLKMCNNELVHLYSPQNLLVIAKSAFFQSHKATKDAREYLKVLFVIHIYVHHTIIHWSLCICLENADQPKQNIARHCE